MDIDAWTAQLLRKPRTGSDIIQSRQELEQLFHIHMAALKKHAMSSSAHGYNSTGRLNKITDITNMGEDTQSSLNPEISGEIYFTL